MNKSSNLKSVFSIKLSLILKPWFFTFVNKNQLFAPSIAVRSSLYATNKRSPIITFRIEWRYLL